MKAFLQRAALATVMLLATIMARAYDFEVDGIYYNKISDTEVEVTYGDCQYEDTVTIPNNISFSGLTFKVISIGNLAFCHNWGIYAVNIPNTVTSIGDSAFESCGNLKSIELPNSITQIGWMAFSYCESLTSIEIPSSIKTIKPGAFAECNRLSTIFVDAENDFYCAVEGVLFSKDKTCLIQYPNGKEEEAYIIPNAVEYISPNAFAGAHIISIEIPNSVIGIGMYAFLNCRELTSIKLPNSALRIESYAFWECISLPNIFIPESISFIDNWAFDGCVNLSSIFVDKNNKQYSSKDGVLFNKSQSELKRYPPAKKDIKYIIPESVLSLGPGAFRDNVFITSLVLNANVNNVGYAALGSGDNLKEIVVLNSVPPEADIISTSEIYSASTLYVPKESLDDYKKANGWKEFKNIEPIETESFADSFIDSDVKIEAGNGAITVSGAEGGVCRIFDLRGMEVASRTGLSAHESFTVKSPELYIVQVSNDNGKNTIRKVMVK